MIISADAAGSNASDPINDPGSGCVTWEKRPNPGRVLSKQQTDKDKVKGEGDKTVDTSFHRWCINSGRLYTAINE